MNLTEPITQTAKPRKRWPWILTAVGALFVGFALGNTDDGTTAKATGTVEPEVVTETVTETVEVTPAVCIEALDAAELLTHESFVPAFDAVIVILDAAAVFDVAGIEEGTATIEDLTADVGSRVEAYNQAATACRQTAE